MFALGCGPASITDDGGTGTDSASADGGGDSSGTGSSGTGSSSASSSGGGSSSGGTSQTTSSGASTTSTETLPPVPPCGVVLLAYIAHGIGGFAIDGEAENDRSGEYVSGGGDVNGDGVPDVIVGAWRADPNGLNLAGRSYVIFGKANTDAVSLAGVAQGNGGFAIDGEAVGDQSGWPVSAAGDVNDDGFVDVVLGVHLAGEDHYGRSYVVFGKAGTSKVSLRHVAYGIGGFAVQGETKYDSSGRWASGAGDVNGDGLADVIVGAPEASPNDLPSAGRTYVVFGKPDTDEVRLENVTSGTGGFAIDGEAAWDDSGNHVSGAGDINDDGLADVIVSAYETAANGRDAAGRTYVVFGKTDTEKVALADVTLGVGGFALDGENENDHSGFSVSAAGDVNGDGLPDIVMGTLRASPNGLDYSGRTYVVFGKTDTDKVDLSNVTLGTGGFVMDGEAELDWSGRSVSGAGDVNGDGLADVIVGAHGAGPNGVQSGRTYVVFGKTDTDRVSLGDVALGIGGFVLDGESEYDHAGYSVSGAGDISGDGVPDLVVGAFRSDANGLNAAGRTYVVFGGDLSCEG